MIWARWEIPHSSDLFPYFKNCHQLVLDLSISYAPPFRVAPLQLRLQSLQSAWGMGLIAFVNTLCKGTGGKYSSSSCRTHSLQCNSSALLGWRARSQRWQMMQSMDEKNHERARLCSHRTLFMVTRTIILLCHKLLFLFWFFQIFKHIKTVLAHEPHQNSKRAAFSWWGVIGQPLPDDSMACVKDTCHNAEFCPV